MEENKTIPTQIGTIISADLTHAILFRVGKVSKPEKRLEKIQSFIQMLAKGEKFYN